MPGRMAMQATALKTAIAMYGVRKRGCSDAQQLGELAVLPHRVAEPRDAENARRSWR